MPKKSPLQIKTDLEKAVRNCITKKQVLEEFNLHPGGNNYKILNRYIDQFNIDTSHFVKGKNGKHFRHRIPDEEIFIRGSKFSARWLKKRLLQIVPSFWYRCYVCGLKPKKVRNL